MLSELRRPGNSFPKKFILITLGFLIGLVIACNPLTSVSQSIDGGGTEKLRLTAVHRSGQTFSAHSVTTGENTSVGVSQREPDPHTASPSSVLSTHGRRFRLRRKIASATSGSPSTITARRIHSTNRIYTAASIPFLSTETVLPTIATGCPFALLPPPLTHLSVTDSRRQQRRCVYR